MLQRKLLFLAALALVWADDNEKEHLHKCRELMCEKNNESLNNEMEMCFQQESKAIREATADCAKEAAPASDGKTLAFFREACKDRALFTKFDECFDEYEANPTFRDQMKVTSDIVECYNKVFQKYEMDLHMGFNGTHAHFED